MTAEDTLAKIDRKYDEMFRRVDKVEDQPPVDDSTPEPESPVKPPLAPSYRNKKVGTVPRVLELLRTENRVLTNDYIAQSLGLTKDQVHSAINNLCSANGREGPRVKRVSRGRYRIINRPKVEAQDDLTAPVRVILNTDSGLMEVVEDQVHQADDEGIYTALEQLLFPHAWLRPSDIPKVNAWAEATKALLESLARK